MPEPTAVPENVLHYVSQQLGINASKLSNYCVGRSTRNHAQEIRQIYGYYDFAEQPYHWRLVRWLYTRAWLTAERSSIIFDLATARCVEQKIILPGVTVMARLISQIRDRATRRLWRMLAELPDENQCKMLEKLLESVSKNRKTVLDTLRQQPKNLTAPGLIKAIERLKRFQLFGASHWNISKIPMGRIHVLARYASMARAQTVARMNPERRIATLVSFAIVFTKTAQDDVLEVMERLLTELFSSSNRKGQKTRLRTIKDLDAAARKLREVCTILLDEKISDNDMRTLVFSKIPKEELRTAIETVDNLTHSPDQTVAYEELFQ